MTHWALSLHNTCSRWSLTYHHFRLQPWLRCIIRYIIWLVWVPDSEQIALQGMTSRWGARVRCWHNSHSLCLISLVSYPHRNYSSRTRIHSEQIALRSMTCASPKGVARRNDAYIVYQPKSVSLTHSQASVCGTPTLRPEYLAQWQPRRNASVAALVNAWCILELLRFHFVMKLHIPTGSDSDDVPIPA